MVERLREFFSTLFTVRGAVFLFGKACLVTAVILTFAAGERFNRPNELQLNRPAISTTEPDATTRAKPAFGEYQVVVARSIFGAKPVATPTGPPPPTILKLRLVGTNLGKDNQRFAIIEDTAKNTQDVFGPNENVFGQARLIDIAPESVRLDRNGQIETLVFEDRAPGPATASEGPPSDDQSEFTVAESELSDALANLPVLLSQARAVPYFRNGQSIGMRLFAIRRDSLYEKLGLKNGDIVLAVNDNSLSDPSQALKLFEQLKNERSVQVKLERNGESRQLQYSIR